MYQEQQKDEQIPKTGWWKRRQEKAVPRGNTSFTRQTKFCFPYDIPHVYFQLLLRSVQSILNHQQASKSNVNFCINQNNTARSPDSSASFKSYLHNPAFNIRIKNQDPHHKPFQVLYLYCTSFRCTLPQSLPSFPAKHDLKSHQSSNHSRSLTCDTDYLGREIWRGICHVFNMICPRYSTEVWINVAPLREVGLRGSWFVGEGIGMRGPCILEAGGFTSFSISLLYLVRST